MDSKTIKGKTVVFAIIVAFVALFLFLFGTAYTLVAVTAGISAMIMLSKDLSVRPFANLTSLMCFMVAMGVGSYVASLNPYLGLLVNFGVVFGIVFLSMQDLKSPMHFPLLLAYAAMTALPVDVVMLPDRLAILAFSAVFIVALNVLVNRGSNTGTSHRAIASICREVRRCADSVLEGGSPDTTKLERLCSEANRVMYDRLKSYFFTTPKDRRILDLVVSLMDLGREICERERSPETLRGISDIMARIERLENGEATTDEVRTAIESFLDRSPDIGYGSTIALKDTMRELADLDAPSNPQDDYNDWSMTDFQRLALSLKEDARTDSARFTFAVRMGLIFTLATFAWDLWGWDGAHVLLFTVVALLTPYLEDSRRMSFMRLSGTVMGAVFFTLFAITIGTTDPLALLILGLLAGYLYVILDTGRYDRRMFFYTILVLVVAALTSTSPGFVASRLVYTFAGILVALIANRVILPYRVSDEVVELSIRFLVITRQRIGNISKAVMGEDDVNMEASLSVLSVSISQKMRMAVERMGDDRADRFLIRQDSLSMQCASLHKAVKDMGAEGREAVRAIMSRDPNDGTQYPPMDVSRMSQYDSECVRRAEMVMFTYRENKDLTMELIVRDMLLSRNEAAV